MKRSFYGSEHAPYYIGALDYIQQSAGIRALHYLCHALNESGLEAYVTCEGVSPFLHTPVLTGNVLQHHHIARRSPIVVYPEIIHGDPLAAGGVIVRWLLNRPGHIAGPQEFSSGDMIFTYDPSYLPSSLQGEVLHIPTCDLSIFNNDANPWDDKRDLICYYAHKYLSKGGQIDDKFTGAVSLCKDQKMSHAEIAAILRRSKVLYVYEPTALITEALLCGCPVSIVVTDYWRENTADSAYPEDWGVIMNDLPDSLERAAMSVRHFRKMYEETVVRDAWVHLDRFVAMTQEAANSRNAHG